MVGPGAVRRTPAAWRLGSKRKRVPFALAVHRGIVLQVYDIHHWQPVSPSSFKTRNFDDVRLRGRWPFSGTVSDDAIGQKYIGKSVAHYLMRGSRAPVIYLSVEQQPGRIRSAD